MEVPLQPQGDIATQNAAPPQSESAAKHILRGVLHSLVPDVPSGYNINAQGQFEPVPHPPGHDFKRMFGGILAGALTGLSGGIEATSRPGGPHGGLAAFAGGAAAERERLQQEDKTLRQKALQSFQAGQERQRTELERRRVTDEEARTAQETLRNIEMAHHQTFEEQRTQLQDYLKMEKDSGFLDTLAPDIPNNGVPGNTLNILKSVPMDFQKYLPTASRDRVVKIAGNTVYVFDRKPDPDFPAEVSGATLQGSYPHLAKQFDPKQTYRLDPTQRRALAQEEGKFELEDLRGKYQIKAAEIRAQATENRSENRGNRKIPALPRGQELYEQMEDAVRKQDWHSVEELAPKLWGGKVDTPGILSDKTQFYGQMLARLRARSGFLSPPQKAVFGVIQDLRESGKTPAEIREYLRTSGVSPDLKTWGINFIDKNLGR